MAHFDSGVVDYVRAKATVYVNFPIDARGNVSICCDACFYHNKTTNTCALTKRVTHFPSKYVGDECPLEQMEE